LLTPKQQYKLNDGQIRARIKEGDIFEYIGKNPKRSEVERKAFDLTGSEILRLKDRGVSYTLAPEEKILEILGPNSFGGY